MENVMTEKDLASKIVTIHAKVTKALQASLTHAKQAWFRDATRPSYIKAQELQKAAIANDDPKLEVMQQMMSGGIPAAMCVELVDFCEKNGISLEKLRSYYQEVRLTHKQHQLEGRYTELSHCGFLLKKRIEKIAQQG
jgi:hypothetical protein